MKKLRREFVVAVFLSVTLVFVLSIAVTSLWMVRSNNHSADIITKILKKAGDEGLSRKEIVKQVLKERKVKETTVLLNLQNKKLFTKVGKDSYKLAA